MLGIAAEGTLAPGASPFRAVVIGDGDFASNSFLPYMSNSDLLVAAVRWLAREERGTAVRTRIPVPPMVLLTAAQSRWLFILIVIVLPLTVIAIGGAGLVVEAMSALSLRRLAMPLLAVMALAWLVAMVVTGAQPVQRQLVKFEAKGVLRIEPDAVRKITLGGGGRQAALVRGGDGGWALEGGGAVEGAAATHLDTAVKMLHRSGPVREIAPEELSGVDTRPFGLEEPVVVATLSGPAGQPLTVRFGALNPEGFLQYMRIDGDPKVYLMSRFIGAEWMAALEGVTAR